jgi:hypothetical protein
MGMIVGHPHFAFADLFSDKPAWAATKEKLEISDRFLLPSS